jgi:hypothetical protein
MSQQHIQNNPREDLNADEQEPIVVIDRKGIVIVWPDQHVQRFPWSVLRQLAVHNGDLTLSESNGVRHEVHCACALREKEQS